MVIYNKDYCQQLIDKGNDCIKTLLGGCVLKKHIKFIAVFQTNKL